MNAVVERFHGPHLPELDTVLGWSARKQCEERSSLACRE